MVSLFSILLILLCSENLIAGLVCVSLVVSDEHLSVCFCHPRVFFGKMAARVFFPFSVWIVWGFFVCFALGPLRGFIFFRGKSFLRWWLINVFY